jgi:hypothetical protein
MKIRISWRMRTKIENALGSKSEAQRGPFGQMSLRQKISCKGTFKVSAGVVRGRPGNVENYPRTATEGL